MNESGVAEAKLLLSRKRKSSESRKKNVIMTLIPEKQVIPSSGESEVS